MKVTLEPCLTGLGATVGVTVIQVAYPVIGETKLALSMMGPFIVTLDELVVPV